MLESFLYKKLAKFLWNHNLEEQDLIVVKNNERKSEGRAVLELASQVFGFDAKTIEHVFSPPGNVSQIVKEPTTWKHSTVAYAPQEGRGCNTTQDERSTVSKTSLTSLIASRCLLAILKNMMVRPSLFDYMFAIYVDLNEFELDVAGIDDLKDQGKQIAIPYNDPTTGNNLYGLVDSKYLMPLSWDDTSASVHMKSIYVSADIKKGLISNAV